MFLYTTAPAIAAFARYNMVNTINGPDHQGTLVSEAPTWVKNWEKTGLIKHEDKNGDGRMFYSGDARNEMTIDRDIMVLANPEIAKLPDWVIALVAAGAIAAALSTAAGLLLVISTSISHDLLKRNLMPNISDKAELRYARGAAAVAILVAGYLGINPPGFVAEVVAFAFGLAAASFLPCHHLGDLLQEDEQRRGQSLGCWPAWSSPSVTSFTSKASLSPQWLRIFLPTGG